jgi:hypothetical protein
LIPSRRTEKIEEKKEKILMQKGKEGERKGQKQIFYDPQNGRLVRTDTRAAGRRMSVFEEKNKEGVFENKEEEQR